MGSRSKSSSATNSSTTNNDITRTVSSVDNRVAQDNAVIGGNIDIQSEGNLDNLSITQTDFGSVQASIDAVENIAIGSGNLIDGLTGDLISATNSLNERALTFAETALQSGVDTFRLNLQTAEQFNDSALGFSINSQQEQGGAVNRTLMIAILAASGVAAAALLRR